MPMLFRMQQFAEIDLDLRCGREADIYLLITLMRD
jgi:hypothetical protein